jgi:D-cysteine desulfhydrase family pyridoxal phosphate-dependent enzyme
MTGGPELGGNKIRKLEFLLADALANNYNSVVTIGGEQSNHCRATAAAARMVNLEPHLILRSKRATDLTNFGYTGNILVDRMVGSTLYTCTPGEYGRLGSNELVRRLCAYIESEGEKNNNRPYPIPVGGSNGLGSWGYINGVYELLQQWESSGFGSLDHVVFACGSGGTAAGIALGIALAYLHAGADSAEIPIVHAMGVCDDPEYFYDYVAKIADEMGFIHSSMDAGEFVRQHLVVHQAEGLGYAASTPEELDFVSKFAVETGVVLDPVYSGKALYHFLTQVVQEDSDEYQGKNVLFWHTGGALGLYDKGEALLDTLNQISPVKRLDVYEKGGKDEVKI